MFPIHRVDPNPHDDGHWTQCTPTRTQHVCVLRLLLLVATLTLLCNDPNEVGSGIWCLTNGRYWLWNSTLPNIHWAIHVCPDCVSNEGFVSCFGLVLIPWHTEVGIHGWAAPRSRQALRGLICNGTTVESRQCVSFGARSSVRDCVVSVGFVWRWRWQLRWTGWAERSLWGRLPLD